MIMNNKTPAYSLDNSLGHLTTQLSRVILRRISQELASQGYAISAEQWSILIHVWTYNGQPQYVFSETLNKDKTTVARLVANIEEQGLITRIPGSTDAREKIVCLTEKGRVVMGKIIEIVQKVLTTATDGIAEAELEICREVLRKAHRNLV